MRPIRHWAVVGLTLAVLLLIVAPPVGAEVSGGTTDDSSYYVLTLGLTEDPDPIGASVEWEEVQQVDEATLNADGSFRDDGRPHVVYDPNSGFPLVVWAMNAGYDYDIVVAEWLGHTWSDFYFLAQTGKDELDPRAQIDDNGSVHVAWWVDDGPGIVQFATRSNSDGLWSLPQVATTDGKRPSVHLFQRTLLLAFERDVAGGKEIVLAERHPNGSFIFSQVTLVPSTGPLDAVLHSYEGRLWIDWKASPTEFAYSELTMLGWSTPVVVPWDDTTWLGEEQVRRVIRSQLLFP